MHYVCMENTQLGKVLLSLVELVGQISETTAEFLDRGVGGPRDEDEIAAQRRTAQLIREKLGHIREMLTTQADLD
jgi:hypothetical protein